MTLLTRDPAPPARRPTEPGTLAVRIHGGGLDGRVVRLQSPKCAVGSGPRCTLRVLGKGVRPLHCLIVRSDRGLFVRRWSPDTRLNGRPFEQARLHPGDRLTIGPLHLEVLSGDAGAPSGESPTAEVGFLPPGPRTTADIGANEGAADASTDGSPADVPLTIEAAEALRQRIATQRKRARGLVEALRASRRHEQELTRQAADALAAQQQVQQQIEQLTSDVRSASDQRAALHEQLEALRQEKAQLAGEYEHAQRELQELRDTRLDQASADGSGKSDEPRASGEETSIPAELEQRMAELSADLDAHKERERALIAQLKLSKERQNALRQQLHEASSEQTRTSAEMEAKLAELDRGKEELAELRREFQQERARLAAERAAWEEDRSRSPTSEEPDPPLAARSSVDEAEAAIAHLRELSLWSDDGPPEEATEPPRQLSASGSPVSFLDKYAPQLLDEDSEPVVPRRAAGSDLPPATDDDESLDDYMAKLMQRVRGDEPQTPPRKTTPRSAAAVERSSNPAVSTTPAKDTAKAARSTAAAATQPAAPSDQSAKFRLQDIKRSRILPERRSNFAAMRELANQSAHTAISDYRARRLVQELVMTLLSGSICLAAGVIALYLATGLRSPAAIGGGAALLLAAYFFIRGGLGLCSIVREERQTRARGRRGAAAPVAGRETAKAAAEDAGADDETQDAEEDAAPSEEGVATAESAADDGATLEEVPAEEPAGSSQPA